MFQLSEQYTRVKNSGQKVLENNYHAFIPTLTVPTFLWKSTSPSFNAASAQSQMNFTAGKAGRINPSLFPKAKRKNTRHLSTQPSAKSSSSSSSGVQEGGGGPAKRTVCLAVSACKHSATCYHWCASVTAGTML